MAICNYILQVIYTSKDVVFCSLTHAHACAHTQTYGL